MDEKSNRRLSGLLGGLLAIIVTAGPGIQPALAAICTLTSPTTWTLGSSGVWGTAANWNPATIPNSSSTNVCIVDGTSMVSLNGNFTVGDLQLASGNTVALGGSTLSVGGTSIINAGAITSNDGNLTLQSNVQLSGGGTITTTSDTFINQSGGSFTLTNVDNTIQGTGQFGQNGLAITNESAGTINATGGTLTMNGGGTITNTGLLGAVSTGTLTVQNTVDNTGGNITANVGTVNLASHINGGTLNQINGGTLNTSGATLNGVTISTGSTVTNGGGTTNLQGTITNNGTLTSPNGNFTVLNGDVTLTGGGTVNMQSDTFFNQSGGSFTLHNVDNTIQGTGQLGQNGLALDNQAGGVVNANTNGGTLTMNGGGTITNAGLLEATNNGTLTIQNTVNNTGNITANGGTVNLASTINGGTLNSINSGTLNGGNAILNGVTISSGSTLNDTGTINLQNTITNQGNISLPNTTLTVLNGNVTLTGGGTVTMSNDAFFNESGGSFTLHNVNNTIQGTGQLGQNGLALDNQANGIVNATGGTLSLNGGGTVTNAGLLEATPTGTLTIQNTVNNTGNITASGGTVNLASTINGGTLNSINAGTLNGGNAILNGVTISSGSTLNDTGSVFLQNTITNKGNISVPNTNLTVLNGNVTLTGDGTVAMSSDAFFNQSGGSFTLNNINNTIQGTGQLGQNGLTINNGGIILANVNGGTLSVNGGGILTNTGTLKATNGGTLLVSTPLSTTDFSGGVLQGGGIYVVNGTVHPSTLQINSLGNTGGEITTIGAGTTLVLDGTGANTGFLDAAGKDALAITTNEGNIYLEGGQDGGVTGTATNSGNLLIDSTSSLTTTGNYVQTAGITQVDGTLTAPLVEIDGGVLEGGSSGTPGNVNGPVAIANGAAIQAGDTLAALTDPPGTLDIAGPLDLNGGSTVNETISGSALADISLLNVTGNVDLGSSVGVDAMLLNGFKPTTSTDFIFLTYTGTLHQQTFFVTDPTIPGVNGTWGIGYGANDAYLTFTPNTSAVPEPATFLPLAGLLASLAYGIRRRKQSKQAA
jgi:fibronectin-binding autotransporter adhesin